jgi:pyruvate,orthophosphate dikinase
MSVSTKRANKNKRVYFFSNTHSEGNRGMRELLGGKGANLAEMASIGLPVPPGFTITTATCAEFYANNEQLPAGLHDEILKHIRRLERETGKRFGSEQDPLLLSVRSGAAVSML